MDEEVRVFMEGEAILVFDGVMELGESNLEK